MRRYNIVNENVLSYPVKERMVIIHLILTMDDDNGITLSIRKLSELTGLTVKQVRKVISDLVFKGVLKTEKPEEMAQKRAHHKILLEKQIFKQLTQTKGGEKGTKEGTLNNDEKYSFDNVWVMYKKKKGRNKGLERKWSQLDQNERDAVLDFVPIYVALTEETYRKDFHTFLNQRTWEDEKISTNGISIPVSAINKSPLERGNLYVSFVDFFNRSVNGTAIPQIVELTEHRRVLINIMSCVYPGWIKTVIEKTIKSRFLNGSESNWRADFDWMFNPVNARKIVEGNYDR